MRNFLLQHGFIHYSTGCPCVGSPRYYRNPQYPDYKIILKGGTATLRIYGLNKLVTKELETLQQKMIELNIINQ